MSSTSRACPATVRARARSPPATAATSWGSRAHSRRNMRCTITMSLVSHSFCAALGAVIAAQAAASMGRWGCRPRIWARMRSRDSSVFSCARAWACTLRTSSSSVSPVMTAPDGPQVRLILMAMLLLVVDGAGCRTLDAECAEKHMPGPAPPCGALIGENGPLFRRRRRSTHVSGADARSPRPPVRRADPPSPGRGSGGGPCGDGSGSTGHRASWHPRS